MREKRERERNGEREKEREREREAYRHHCNMHYRVDDIERPEQGHKYLVGAQLLRAVLFDHEDQKWIQTDGNQANDQNYAVNYFVHLNNKTFTLNKSSNRTSKWGFPNIIKSKVFHSKEILQHFQYFFYHDQKLQVYCMYKWVNTNVLRLPFSFHDDDFLCFIYFSLQMSFFCMNDYHDVVDLQKNLRTTMHTNPHYHKHPENDTLRRSYTLRISKFPSIRTLNKGDESLFFSQTMDNR